MAARKRAPGAGRKTADKGAYKKLRSFTFVVDPSTLASVRKLGRGSTSAGMRMLIANYLVTLKEQGKA